MTHLQSLQVRQPNILHKQSILTAKEFQRRLHFKAQHTPALSYQDDRINRLGDGIRPWNIKLTMNDDGIEHFMSPMISNVMAELLSDSIG